MGLIKVQITIFMGVIFYRDVQQLTDTLKPVRNMSNTALMLFFFFFLKSCNVQNIYSFKYTVFMGFTVTKIFAINQLKFQLCLLQSDRNILVNSHS